MSIQTIINTLNQLNKDIANLEKQFSDESKKEYEKVKRMNDIQKSITKNTSLSSLNSKQRELSSLNNDTTRIAQKKAEIRKKISDKTARVNSTQEQLYKEQEKERKKQEDVQKKSEQKYLKYQLSVTEELMKQKELLSNSVPETTASSNDASTEQYDVFISHASEDKDEFVRPLATLLIENYNIKVWYDEFSLKWGDSLRSSIDKGLKASRFGIVVLSNDFFKKHWTQYELDGLFMRQMNGDKVVLPIWHKVSKDEVMAYSPTVAGIKALNTAMYSNEEIASELNSILSLSN